jgi:hypothetical protein
MDLAGSKSSMTPHTEIILNNGQMYIEDIHSVEKLGEVDASDMTLNIGREAIHELPDKKINSAESTLKKHK